MKLEDHIIAHPQFGMIVPVEIARLAVDEARLEEREACAKIAEDGKNEYIALYIRARGDHAMIAGKGEK